MKKNSHEKLPPASVTKVMTMLLICEALESGKIKEDDDVQISEVASSMGGSQIFLEPGEIQKSRYIIKINSRCISQRCLCSHGRICRWKRGRICSSYE
ncbi:MAG: serine hydrolase [Terrisporobacter sp.]